MQLEKWSRKHNVQIQADSKSERDIGMTIQEIQRDLEKDRKGREKEKAKYKEKRAFDKLPRYTLKMGFWCDHCQLDFIAPAHKFWSSRHNIGTWQTFCPNCHAWVYRYITSKVLDPYYFKSQYMMSMRGVNAKDLIQPGEFGFKTLYDDPFENYYMQFQKRQEELFNKYAAMGLVGKTLSQKSDEEELGAEDFDV